MSSHMEEAAHLPHVLFKFICVLVNIETHLGAGNWGGSFLPAPAAFALAMVCGGQQAQHQAGRSPS